MVQPGLAAGPNTRTGERTRRCDANTTPAPGPARDPAAAAAVAASSPLSPRHFLSATRPRPRVAAAAATVRTAGTAETTAASRRGVAGGGGKGGVGWKRNKGWPTGRGASSRRRDCRAGAVGRGGSRKTTAGHRGGGRERQWQWRRQRGDGPRTPQRSKGKTKTGHTPVAGVALWGGFCTRLDGAGGVAATDAAGARLRSQEASGKHTSPAPAVLHITGIRIAAAPLLPPIPLQSCPSPLAQPDAAFDCRPPFHIFHCCSLSTEIAALYVSRRPVVRATNNSEERPRTREVRTPPGWETVWSPSPACRVRCHHLAGARADRGARRQAGGLAGGEAGARAGGLNAGQAVVGAPSPAHRSGQLFKTQRQVRAAAPTSCRPRTYPHPPAETTLASRDTPLLPTRTTSRPSLPSHCPRTHPPASLQPAIHTSLCAYASKVSIMVTIPALAAAAATAAATAVVVAASVSSAVAQARSTETNFAQALTWTGAGTCAGKPPRVPFNASLIGTEHSRRLNATGPARR